MTHPISRTYYNLLIGSWVVYIIWHLLWIAWPYFASLEIRFTLDNWFNTGSILLNFLVIILLFVYFLRKEFRIVALLFLFSGLSAILIQGLYFLISIQENTNYLSNVRWLNLVLIISSLFTILTGIALLIQIKHGKFLRIYGALLVATSLIPIYAAFMYIIDKWSNGIAFLNYFNYILQLLGPIILLIYFLNEREKLKKNSLDILDN